MDLMFKNFILLFIILGMLHILVGKIRQKWYTETVSAVGRGSLEAVKSYLDPQNIFAAGNLFQQAKL